MIDLLKQKLADAELVLVGIGEEWEIKKTDYESIPEYDDAVSRCKEKDFLIPFLQKEFLAEKDFQKAIERREEYRILSELLKDKNYFVVSLCTDGFLQDSGLNRERMVEPCGTLKRLQCSNKCTADFYQEEEAFKEQLQELIKGTALADSIKEPVCPKCGKPLVFNTILAENYAEEGYLSNWNIYTKWLQGTVNRKVCILELGVGMRFPTVIRWPFEKVAFFNQKASFFRVHSTLYQITEEIKDRSYGIKATPEEFIRELSNGI